MTSTFLNAWVVPLVLIVRRRIEMGIQFGEKDGSYTFEVLIMNQAQGGYVKDPCI